MTQPAQKTWYVTAARVTPTWGTAVVAGKATIDLFKIVDVPGTDNDQLSKWKETGQPVSAQEVADATASNTAAGAVPALRTPATGKQTVLEGALRHRGAKVGFNGATPVAKRATTPNATDLATAITLVNALKADLVALGLKA